MDKEFEALKRIGEILGDLTIGENGLPKIVLEGERAKYYKILEQSLLKAQELEKVSAIFKNKPFNMIYFVDEIRPNIYKNSYADYKMWFISKGGRTNDLLTEEEFETLMRYFNE